MNCSPGSYQAAAGHSSTEHPVPPPGPARIAYHARALAKLLAPLFISDTLGLDGRIRRMTPVERMRYGWETAWMAKHRAWRAERIRASVQGDVSPMEEEVRWESTILLGDAVLSAMNSPGIWDRRLAARTRHRRFLWLVDCHLLGWCVERGLACPWHKEGGRP